MLKETDQDNKNLNAVKETENEVKETLKNF